MSTHPQYSKTIDLLRTLVAFDTTSSKPNLPLVEFIESYLQLYNVPCERVNASKHKASLLARVGPEGEGGFVLSGHTDVVPTIGQKWDTDPYTLTLKDGKYFGRGTTDMKSFSAAMLAMVPVWNKLPLQKPIYLSFTHDEEIGCLSAKPMSEVLNAKNIKPDLMIVGEPTEMHVADAHKGIWSYETIVHGLESHSSYTHKGVNAVMVMADLVQYLGKLAAECREKTHNERFEPPYTTIHVGVFEGGTARNIVPSYCRIAWEIRPIPSDHPEVHLERFKTYCAEQEIWMKTFDERCGIETRQISQVPGLRPEHDVDVVSRMLQLAQANDTQAVAFGTESGWFQLHGLPVFVCGPGSIEQAHKPNEFVEESQIAKCLAMMDRIGDWVVEKR